MKKLTILSALILCLASGADAQWKTGAGVQSAAWTSATTLDTRLSVQVRGYSSLLVTLSATSTMTAGTLNFEGSKDSGSTFPWPVDCVRVDTSAGETTFALSVTAKAWQCVVAGFTDMSVRLNPAITGTGTATVTITPNEAPMSPPIAKADAYGALFARSDHPNRIHCVVAVSTATTIQAVGGSCIAPGAGLSIYITDVEFGTSAAAGTAADSFPTLKSGTGGTCGTGTAVIWQGLTAANSTLVSNKTTPIRVATNSEVCWIMTTAGSKTLQIDGYIAP